MLIGYYIITLMYTKVYRNEDIESRYKKGLMPIRLDEFQKYPMHIFDDVEDSISENDQAWTVLARSNLLPHISDPRHFEGGNTSLLLLHANGVNTTVDFLHTIVLESS